MTDEWHHGTSSPRDMGGMVWNSRDQFVMFAILVKRAWTFSIAMDGATHESIS